MNFDAEQIAGATGGVVVRPGAPGPVVTDTRRLRPGEWFLALRGPTFDGHDHVSAALAAGAAGVVVERPVGDTAGCVVVSDGLRALQALGLAARRRYAGPVLALTGSNGKTTTRVLSALAASPLGQVHQTVGNHNNHVGVPQTLLAGEGHEAAWVVEAGTSGPGEIALLESLIEPSHRLVLNVGPAHLQELGGLEGVAVEKLSLARPARPGDTVLLNADDPRLASFVAPRGVNLVWFGRAPSAQVRILDARLDSALDLTVDLSTPTGPLTVCAPLPGLHLASNVAAAVAFAWSIGVVPAAVAEALRGYQPEGLRLRRQALKGGLEVLNDAYNANPGSMSASLGALTQWPGRKFAVLGDMLELGKLEAELHEQVLREAVALGLDGVITLGPRMALAAKKVGLPWGEDPAAVARWLVARVGPGDCVLLKGSRGARVERVADELLSALGDPS